MSEQSHVKSDLVQVSFIHYSGASYAEQQVLELMKLLQYPAETTPFHLFVNSEEEEKWDWDEDQGLFILDEEAAIDAYKPTLDWFDGAIHPIDSQFFILIATWYDDINYMYQFRFYIRCPEKYQPQLHDLFLKWQQEEFEDEYTYEKGIYVSSLSKIELTDKQKELITEAENYIQEVQNRISLEK